MAAQLSAGRTARVCVAVALALALVSAAGCSGGSDGGSAKSSTPVAAPKVIRGALPGFQVVAVSKLGKTDQRAIEMWQLAGDAHRTMFVGIRTDPELRDVFKRPVVGQGVRVEMAVVVDDRQPRGVLVVEPLGRCGLQQEIIVDKPVHGVPFTSRANAAFSAISTGAS